MQVNVKTHIGKQSSRSVFGRMTLAVDTRERHSGATDGVTDFGFPFELDHSVWSFGLPKRAAIVGRPRQLVPEYMISSVAWS